MTTQAAPDPLAAAFAWLDSHRGIDRGEADVHAGVLQAYIDRLSHEWQVMRDELAASRLAAARVARAEAVITAVHQALDAADPHDPAALAHLARTIGDLLHVTHPAVRR